MFENVTYIYQMKVQQLKVATYEKKRSEMEVIIRKKDLDIVSDTFRKVCDHVEEEGTKITLEHKCCLAYVVDCPGAKKSKLSTYNVPAPPLPVSMRDDQETVQKLKREVARLRLMKEGLDEETKRSLEKVSVANKMLYKKEEEEKELNKKMEAERIQLNLNQQKRTQCSQCSCTPKISRCNWRRNRRCNRQCIFTIKFCGSCVATTIDESRHNYIEKLFK